MIVLQTLFTVAVVLGVMIFIHELGHFIVAKFFGVRVEVFSIGFGKRLLGVRRGGTDYRLSAIPLGGYVKMAGENPLEARTGDPGEFMSHPRWQRFFIALAGPTANIMLAVGLLTGIYMFHYERPAFSDKPVVLGWVVEKSPASQAGLQPGDKITRIDGIIDPKWDDVTPRLLLSPGQPIELAYERNGHLATTMLTPSDKGPEDFDFAGLVPDSPVVVRALEKGLPAEKAGLQLGDELVAIDGIALRSVNRLLDHLQEKKTNPVELTVVRGGAEKKFVMNPVLTDISDSKLYRLGFSTGQPYIVEQLTFGQALQHSLEQNKKYSLLIIELMQRLAQRPRALMKQIEGPIGIARASGEAVRQPGWTPIFGLTAAISLNLGIFNLFPIPIMDGGVILLLAIEGLMRRDISQRIKERIYQASFVFLVLFAMIVIFNDIAKTLAG